MYGQPGLMRVRACIGEDSFGCKQYQEAPVTHADARLIAAAPDLLAALRAIAAHQENVAGSMAAVSTTWAIATRAIAKAGF